MEKVFVYGTLLSGERNNHLITEDVNSKLLGDAKIQGFSLRNLGAFPAVIPVSDVKKEVVGEVWEITDNILYHLDILEGHPYFYERILVSTFFGEAWVYVNLSGEEYEEILSGSWKQHLAERNL